MPGEIKWALSFVVGAALVALGWKVPFVLTIVHVLISFMLVVVVLLQSGKAADLAGAFGGAGSQTAFGPRGAAAFLSKATTWCAVMFMLTSIALGLRPQTGAAGGSVLERFSKPATKQQPAPVSPAPQPPAQSAPAPNPPTQNAPAQQPTPAAPAHSQPAPQSQPPKK